jgi:hypothetical protein
VRSVDLIGTKPDHWGGLRWTFDAVWDDRRTRAHAQTSTDGHLLDLQTDDGCSGSTGVPELDDRIVQHIRRIIIFHDTLRILDDARRPRARKAA